MNSTAEDWTYSETNANSSIVEISAKDALEARDSSRVDLKGVVLKLYKKRSGTYDLVKSAAASYFKGDHRFYSEGDVEITLDVPIEGEAKHQLISIKSSGVNFDTNKGRRTRTGRRISHSSTAPGTRPAPPTTRRRTNCT